MRRSDPEWVLPLTRRQLAGAAGGGALVGSIWAAVFRQALAGDDEVTVTVTRSGSALAAMVAWQRHRIAILDGPDPDGAAGALALTAGFMRQRVDTILAPTLLAAQLPRELLERWQVRDVWTLPDLPNSSGRGLEGRTMSSDDLRIEADALPLGAWRADAATVQAWYVAITFGAARVTVASDGAAIDRLPLPSSMVHVVVCGDIEMRAPARAKSFAALAVPAEVIGALRDAGGIIPLARDGPVVFRLHEDGIELPAMV